MFYSHLGAALRRREVKKAEKQQSTCILFNGTSVCRIKQISGETSKTGANQHADCKNDGEKPTTDFDGGQHRF